ncbi:histidine phosphatase family protein [Paracoccaceae bacterium]|jgi:phosphohistidine phosphatase|nr:histidine phosphatase family protein [Paracoccaceae bacterium]
MRHTKSDWHLNLPDHARPLNKRGRRASTALGTWLRHNQYLPDEIISSTANRTLETCDRLKLGTQPRTSGKLYLASHDTMLDVLRTATSDTVLMLGHNPGIYAFAHALLASYPNHRRFEDYPSGATLIAEFKQTEWLQIKWGTGQPNAFVTPADLSA